ncbi:MAG TPA: Hsp20/alpha crystallin family protein [Caldilineaceae bacterium]|nr:Hsp20/alpha crystallin family protein [Caldilineaceae bacterium]
MTTLTRWEPLREMADMRRNMDRMMERFFEDPFYSASPAFAQRNGGSWSLALDVSEDADQYTIKASLPGVNPNDIEITLTDNILTVKGEIKDESESKEQNWHLRERRYGSFVRSVALPAPVDADKVTAHNENGVLTLTLPKAEAVKPKKIAVTSTVSSNRSTGVIPPG